MVSVVGVGSLEDTNRCFEPSTYFLDDLLFISFGMIVSFAFLALLVSIRMSLKIDVFEVDLNPSL